jgi:hypothetical protein
MPEIPDSIALVIIWGLVQVINRGVDLFAGWRSDDAHADELSAAREEQWMRMVQTMLDSTLSAQHTRYAEFVQQVQAGFETVTAKIQGTFTAALTELVDQMSIRMSAVTDQRNAKLDSIQADVRAVPEHVKTDTDVQFDSVRAVVTTVVGDLGADLKRELQQTVEKQLTVQQVEGVIDRTLMHRLLDLSAKLDALALVRGDTTDTHAAAASPEPGEGAGTPGHKED